MADAFVRDILHICVVTDDFDRYLNRTTTILGVGPFKCWTFDPPDRMFNTIVDGRQVAGGTRLAMAYLGNVHWEVLQPLTDEIVPGRFLSRHGVGLHHIMFDTQPRYQRALSVLADRGVTPDQSHGINVGMKIGPVSLPPVPKIMRDRLCSKQSYFELIDDLGTTIEIGRMPPGMDVHRAIALGKADYWMPEDSPRQLRGTLPNALIRNVGSITLLVPDLNHAVESYARILGVNEFTITRHEHQVGNDGPYTTTDARLALPSGTLTLRQPGEGDGAIHHLLAKYGAGACVLDVTTNGTTDDAVSRLTDGGCTMVENGVRDGKPITYVDAYPVAGVILGISNLS